MVGGQLEYILHLYYILQERNDVFPQLIVTYPSKSSPSSTSSPTQIEPPLNPTQSNLLTLLTLLTYGVLLPFFSIFRVFDLFEFPAPGLTSVYISVLRTSFSVLRRVLRKGEEE